MAVFCKQRSQVGMVDISKRNCAHYSCRTRPSFNVRGSKTPAYCKQHSEDGMVDVRTKRCSNDSCSKRAKFKAEGDKAAKYCKQRSHHGTVKVRRKRCSRDSCFIDMHYNGDGNKKPVPCKRHGKGDMANVCPHRANAPTRHKNDCLSREAVTPDSSCDVGNVRERRRLELEGEQSLYYLGDRPFKEGAVVEARGDGSHCGWSSNIIFM